MGTNGSAADIGDLAAVLDRQSTGLSPVFHDRLILVLKSLGVDQLDRQSIGERTGLMKRHQLRPVLAAGRRPDLSVLVRHCRGAGMGHGRKPDEYSVNWVELKARRRVTSTAEVAGRSLSAKQIQLLEKLDWRRAGFENVYRFLKVAELVAAIAGIRRVSQEELARELGWGVATLKRAKGWAVSAKFLTVKVSYDTFSGVPSEWRVDWNRISRFADGNGVGRNGLSIPNRRLANRPTYVGALSDQRRNLLSRVTIAKANVDSQAQLTLLRMLIEAVGEDRTLCQPDLQRELKIGRSTAERAFALGRKSGLVQFEKKWDGVAGRIRTHCVVNWEKIEALAGDRPEPTKKKRPAAKPAETEAAQPDAPQPPGKSPVKKKPWPRWDTESRVFQLDASSPPITVRKNATAVRRLLDAFDVAEWPEHIVSPFFDPFAHANGIKAGNGQSLGLKFYSDGTGLICRRKLELTDEVTELTDEVI